MEESDNFFGFFCWGLRDGSAVGRNASMINVNGKGIIVKKDIMACHLAARWRPEILVRLGRFTLDICEGFQNSPLAPAKGVSNTMGGTARWT